MARSNATLKRDAASRGLRRAASAPVTRRQTVGVGLAAAGGMFGLAGASLSSVARAAARPSRAAANPVVLNINPDISDRTPAFIELFNHAIEPLLRAHRGLRVNLLGPWTTGTQAITTLIGGAAPDIFGDYILTDYTAAGVALDLTPYVRHDNLNLGQFPAGQIQYIRQAGALSAANPTGLYALPSQSLFTAHVVNLGVLDELALKYPQPDWTYREWSALWQAATRKARGSTPARAGGMIDWRGYNSYFNGLSPWVLWGWGGEYVDPADNTRCYLGSPGSIACAQWAYDLTWNGVVTPQGAPAWTYDNNFQGGTIVAYLQDSSDLPAAATMYRSLKWDFFALPIMPKRNLSYNASTIQGIWAGTKHPDAAWIVLKWLSTNTEAIRFLMRTKLFTPSRLDLFPEWAEIVRQVAPPLRDKNLEAYVDQAVANNEYIGNLFAFANDQVTGIVNDLNTQLWNRKATVADAFRGAASQIDALEGANRAVSLAAQRFERAYVHDVAAADASSAVQRFPAPPRKGVGSPAVDDPAQVSTKSGVWAVTGGGAGVMQAADALTFAAAASTASRAVFSARLTGIYAVHPHTIQDGAKFGLMVRGDLSPGAASVGLEVSAGRGVHFHSRPVVGMTLADQKPGGAPGLLAAGGILRADSKPAKNYLTRPVWLRLVREVGQWTAFTSLDGRSWQSAGSPVAARALGVWVGLFVTAHASGTLVRATFDKLQGFVPDTFVRIGAP